MKLSLWATVASLGALGAVAMLACEPNNRVPPGSPQLVRITVLAPTSAPIDLMPEDGPPPAVPPLSTFLAIFDRLLDPTTLETLDGDGGTLPTAGVAVFEWSGGTFSAPATYLPHGDVKVVPFLYPFFNSAYGLGPSLLINPGAAPSIGLPSGQTVTLRLDGSRIRSHDRRSPLAPDAGVSATLTVTTEPLTVQFGLPAVTNDDGGTDVPIVPADFVLTVTLNNFIVPNSESRLTVKARRGGADMAGFSPIVIANEAGTGFVVTGPLVGMATAWPAGATITVTVDAAITDRYGIALGHDATVSFDVKEQP